MLEFFLNLLPSFLSSRNKGHDLNFNANDARRRSECFIREKPNKENERIRRLSSYFYEKVKSEIGYTCEKTEDRSCYVYLYNEKEENTPEKNALIDVSYRLLNECFTVIISNDRKCVHELDKNEVGINASFKCQDPDCVNKTYRGEILVKW